MHRSDLHRLVDTLPDASLAHALWVLEHLPAPPLKMASPGTVGGIAGGGSFNPALGYGHHGHTYREDQTMVYVAQHLFRGHEIAVTERLRLTDDGRAIHYTHEVKGPKADPVLNELTFDLG